MNIGEAEILISMDTEWGVADVYEGMEYYGYHGVGSIADIGTLSRYVVLYIRPRPNPRKAEIVEHYIERERERATGRDPDEPRHPDDF